MNTIHATCVAIEGRGVLIVGPSGSGKSDLALRLIDRGAALVADDYTDLNVDGRALARVGARDDRGTDGGTGDRDRGAGSAAPCAPSRS